MGNTFKKSRSKFSAHGWRFYVSCIWFS